MADQITINPACCALLVMDFQAAIVSIYTKNDAGLIGRAASLLTAARNAGLTVIHFQVAFRPNLPEVSARNMLLSAIKTSPQHRQIFEGAAGAIHPAVAPQGDDIVVTKRRVNAFTGTDLEMILRARDIDTLILFGIATSGVVLSTLLDAADRDYRLIVARDCCADLDAEGHTWLTGKLFPRQAIVAEASEIAKALSSTGPVHGLAQPGVP
jgi:nicotinamidase-related amidase